MINQTFYEYSHRFLWMKKKVLNQIIRNLFLVYRRQKYRLKKKKDLTSSSASCKCTYTTEFVILDFKNNL